MSSKKLVAVACLAVFSAACQDTTSSMTTTPDALSPDASHRPSASAIATLGSAADELSRALALAMNEQDVRVQVRNAMRESAVNEHKLVLREFAGTRAGRRLVEAAARASGSSVEAVDRLIAQLPPMDFYAPFQEHRRSWRGTADVVVGYTMDQNSPLFGAYDAAGRRHDFNADRGAPAQAVLIMHPAEPKSPRENPQTGAGSVIEDAGDGQTTLLDGAGPRMSVDGPGGYTPVDECVAGDLDCVPYSPEEEEIPAETEEYAYVPGATTMQFEGFESNIKDGIGSAELRFIIKNASGSQIAAKRWDGIQRTPFYFFPRTHTFPLGSTITVREIDSWSSDDFGTDALENANWLGYSQGEIVTCLFHYDNNYRVCGGKFPQDPVALRDIPMWRTRIRW